MSKIISFLTILILPIILLFSCSENSQENSTDKQKKSESVVYEPGKFVYNIKCRTDQSESYAAYFPVSYNHNSEFPVIIVFDAHARSKMAVHKFKKAADEFGYIIIVSNNAKNGLKTINKTINALFDDVFFRFNINKKRVYTAGFSGGARIASSIAIYKGGIAGVMAMSGGLPKIGQEILKMFNYASIVGIEDFNYLELKTLDKQLADNEFPHILTVNKKGHAWPNENVIKASIEWFEIKAMKNADLPVNDNLIRNYTENMADSVNNLLQKEQFYDAKILYEQFLSTVSGLFDVSSYQKSYEVLLKNPKIKEQEKKVIDSDKFELDKQQQLLALFKQQQFKKINNELNILIRDTAKVSELQKNKAKRLINFTSMLSYLFTDGALKNNDIKTASKYLSIYKIVDSNNPDYYFFEACIVSDKNKIFSSLNKSVELGFFDVERLISEKNFNKIKNLPEFDIIVNKAKENFEF